METLIAPTFNVLVLVGVLVYYLRKPLREFVETRHTSLRDETFKVSEMLARSQDQFNEYTSKLKMMEVETDSLKEQARQDAKSLRLRILSDARKNYGSIVADSKTACEGMVSEFRLELQKTFGLKIIERAEAILKDKLTKDDRIRLSQEFSQQVGQQVGRSS